MVKVSFLRGVMLLTKGQQPVLHDTGRKLIEGADVVDRQLHAMRDGLKQLLVEDFPAQPLAHHAGDGSRASAGLMADTNVLVSRDRARGRLWYAILVGLAQEPAHNRPRPRPDRARSRLF